MTGDPGWKRNAWPIRLSPNTSTQLSRNSSCSWTRKKKIHAGKRRFPYFPFFLLLPSPELLRSLRKEYASCDISDMISRKKKRRDDSIVETWRESDFSKTENSKQPWPDLRAWKKNRERANRTIFPRDPSSFENTNFEATIKIAWNGHALRSSSFKRIQRGEEEGEEKKERRRRRKRREKTKRKKKKKKEMKKGRGRRDNRYLNG